MNILEGKLVGSEGLHIAIVASRFNEFIVSKLLSGAEDGLVRHGVPTENIDVAWVPGAFEIPVAALHLAQSGKYDAVICLGAVIRGSTSHYDYVCAEVSKGAGLPPDRQAGTLRSAHHRHHRAGHRAGRHQGRQQGL